MWADPVAQPQYISSRGHKMNEKSPFTIEQFYKYVNQGRLMGGKCQNCGKIYLPPRPLCVKCFSREFEWTPIPSRGKVVTYTVIHVAPPQFKNMVPYIVGVIKLEDGTKMPGMIRGVDRGQLKVGLDVKMKFDESQVQQKWPRWPRYYFVPAVNDQ